MKAKMYNYTTALHPEHLASGIILSLFASIVFVAACVVVFLYYWKRLGRALVETRIGIVVFFLGALLTTLVSLGFHNYKVVYRVYMLFLNMSVGIVFLLAGTIIFFDNPFSRGMSDGGRPLIPLGHLKGSMGIVIWVIALPLCVLEMLFAIGAATCNTPAHLYAAAKFVCLIQKLGQASIYYFGLRHKAPNPLIRMGCSWFLKTISLLNFALWVDSIITTHTDNGFVMKLFGNGFSLVKTAYNTLIIDYRLLCSLLFLEHALEIEDNGDSRDGNLYGQIEDVSSHYDLTALPVRLARAIDVKVINYSGYGYVIGLICFGLQLINGLQYLNFVGCWTSIFPILCNIVIIVAGLVLVGATTLENTSDTVRWRETESKAIDVMIGFMGAVGFVYRIMKCAYCSIWSVQAPTKQERSYLIWNSLKEAARAISIIFQLYFFVKIGPHFCQKRRNQKRRVCHLLVPAIMLALLSTFVSCIIDQYNGDVEYLLNQSLLEPAVSSFMDAAAPIHLGFSLHMFLHFYIIKRKMRRASENLRPNHSVHFSEDTMSTNAEGEEDESLEEPLLSRIENRQ